MQYKYVNIRAVLNFIPEAIREEESETNLLMWAFQGFRENTGKTWKYNYKTCLVPVANHKASLPNGVVKVAYVGFSLSKPGCLDTDKDLGYTVDTFHNKTDDNDYRVIIQQQLIPNCPEILGVPLRYVGQNPEVLTKKCMNLYCRDCSIGFSISKTMESITIDTSHSGWLCIVYKTLTRDDDNNIIIPDDPDLLRAMSYFAQAQHWLNRDARKEQGAFQRYQSMLYQASNKFGEANGKAALRAFNPENLQSFIFDRFLLTKHPIATGEGRNRGLTR